MISRLTPVLDWFIPENIRASETDVPMVRHFVMLHLLGPLMGHTVTAFLLMQLSESNWQFWVVEACVASFFLVPLILRQTGSMALAAMVSVQTLVGLSLFGSFWFGGISSPLLPWFLIAMVLCFFYLYDSIKYALIGITLQLATFTAARLLSGNFPQLVDPAELLLPNVFSILAALTYMTVMCLFYEAVMRVSLRLEQETIDQRGRVAELRHAMSAAEQASKRKSIFLAKMSHELRTPLNAVIGYTEMLKEEWIERGEDERKAKDLDRIHAAGRHLLALVNNVIDLSSIESDRIDLNTEPVVVRDLADDVIATASPLARKRDNKLVLNMPEDLGTLELDALKVRQSLLNLLSNAAKFTTKGTIMMTILRSQEKDGDWLTLEVTDNGIGIRPEALERIFKSFSQAENDTATRFGGSGLGLALTKRFTEMMGGTISVRSEYGLSTSFTIRIPAIESSLSERKVA
ncbi:HAMP domain-containing sensor histidine kinase [Erythrobacter alti]|uniref:sensor histidine kinase n=1 Tax=Erythrobacter alti TaxID=1896145 RepID=UPI0030F4836E